ncbi:MAG: hypothetical protein GY711_07575 [bacterium]|nr:hypothetical protein [bacterium]
MARSSYRSRRDDDERDAPPHRRQNAPNMAPLFGFLVLAVIGIGFAGWVQGNKADAAVEDQDEAANKPAKVDPFADIQEEKPPERGEGSTRLRTTNRAPEGLENVANWQSALKLAGRGHDLAAEAEAAKKDGDNATYNTKGHAAWEKFNEALEKTAVWETEIEGLFGDTDRQVRKIKRERSAWFKMLGKYRKTGQGQ